MATLCWHPGNDNPVQPPVFAPTVKLLTRCRFFVATMREHIHEADDNRINTLLAEDCTSLVSRWLVGRNDSKSDVLRETLLFDERVDSIDKSRLLERILHRQNEVLIQELAQKVLDQSSDEVVLSAARNLSTVTDEPSS